MLYLKIPSFCAFLLYVSGVPGLIDTNNITEEINIQQDYSTSSKPTETNIESQDEYGGINKTDTNGRVLINTVLKLKLQRETLDKTLTKDIFVQRTNLPSNHSTTIETKKRKRRKRKRKRKQNYNNILEVTTTKALTYPFSMAFDRNGSKNSILTKNIWFGENTIINQTYSSYLKNQNRCSFKNGGCSQICRLKGKMKCACLKGYTLAKNRKKCVDIDECRIRNGGCKEVCQNTMGSYYCDCFAGFRISEDLRSCQDVNECHLRNGHGPCQDTCTNTYGSYICDCSHLNGSRLNSDRHSCEDIDECSETNIGCAHLCINTRIGGFCSCPDGMELMSDYKTCQDIDECEDISVKISCSRGCINTIGSYYCEDDFQNDQWINGTKIPTCPPLDPPSHGFITCLRNNSLPYDTYTKNGRKIIKNSPGTKCQLECPIGFKLIGGGRFVCGFNGQWVVKKKGICMRATHPKLECPPDQTIILKKGRQTILVHFPRPKTNVRWKIVKSYPKWAKKLRGKLDEGQHNILFSVTDPASRLSSTCSFSVVVKK